ncbi:hypothetical protein AURDEDRAFT_117229 [Auricularia subglabra TFB-10046 SS5]|nr:hypothetical protein AURDEDRAFT_117229 [Auricularia subglabra TFB-10046 SS5]
MSDSTITRGWKEHIHPDGSLYLHHPLERTVIEYPDDENNFDAIVTEATACMLVLWLVFEQMPDDSRPDRDNCELFLRIDPKTQNIRYYFVDYVKVTVFWVEEHSLETPFTAYAQLASILKFQFWNHVERFPAHRHLPLRAKDELHGILVYQVIDVTTNTLSTAPYNAADAALFVKSLENTRPPADGIDGALNASVARLWGEQCRVRSHHLHGAPQVRIERTERRGMIALEPPRRWYQFFALLLLFNEPYSFYKSLMDVFVDEVMYERFWKALYHDTLREEWKDHAFMATVSLAANMAFLTVGNVGGGNTIGSDALSPTSQVLSLCSTMFSIGAIVLGKSLPNFHRRLQRCSAIEVADWMTSFSKEHKDGLYKLAMLFSLPFALFMWSLALFVAALFSFAFEHWVWGTGMPVVVISAMMLGVLVISLLFLRREGGYYFIQPVHRDPRGPMWTRWWAAIAATPQRLRTGVGHLAERWRNRGAQPPESPTRTSNAETMVEDQGMCLSPTGTSSHSAEQMV